MIDNIRNFLMQLPINPALATILSAMLPVLELKGAIPIGMALGLNPFVTYLYAYLGSMIPAVLIVFLLTPVMTVLSGMKAFKKTYGWLERKFTTQADKIQAQAQAKAEFSAELSAMPDTAILKRERRIERIKAWLLFVFVAIPLPLTGVWMGSAAAVFMRMKKGTALLSIAAGNIVSGFLMTAFSVLVALIIA